MKVIKKNLKAMGVEVNVVKHPTLGELVKVVDVEIDGSKFIWVLPTYQMLLDILALAKNSDRITTWDIFWSMQPSNYVLCSFCHPLDNSNLQLYKMAVTCQTDHQDFLVPVHQQKPFVGCTAMPILLPLDQDGNFEFNAFAGIKDGELNKGGSVYKDGTPIVATADSPVYFEGGKIKMGDTSESFQLEWFKFDQALIGTFVFRLGGTMPDKFSFLAEGVQNA